MRSLYIRDQWAVLIPTKKIAHSELSAINISPNNHSFRLEDYGPSTLFRFNTLRLSRNLGMRDRDISERAIALTSEQLSRDSGIRRQ